VDTLFQNGISSQSASARGSGNGMSNTSLNVDDQEEKMPFAHMKIPMKIPITLHKQSPQDISMSVYESFGKSCLFSVVNNFHGDVLDVYTERIVFKVFHQEVDDASNVVYKMVGTVKTLLCKIPVCSHYMKRTFLHELEHAILAHPLQWCVAFLDENSTLEKGRVEIVNWNNTVRIIEHSLLEEMNNMNLLGVRTTFSPLECFPGVDGLDNRQECSIGWFIQNWTAFTENQLCFHWVLPGQGLNLPVYISRGSMAMQKLFKDISILWARSFHIHQLYFKHQNVWTKH
jgi:hypothetical protein